MKPTIRNKLVGGFSAVLVLLTAVAGIGGYAVYSLRSSAYDATRVGSRLNAIAIEIQLHNLEAERRATRYLSALKASSGKGGHEGFLEEAAFEVHEIESLAAQAVDLAPTKEYRDKFEKVVTAVADYKTSLSQAVSLAKKDIASPEAVEAMSAYEDAAEDLHETAEDGEAMGRKASEASLASIESTSSRSVTLVTVISLLGLALGSFVSYKLAHAILDPVEHLKTVAESVSLGNLDIAVRRYSGDEIGDLADSFSRMVTAVKFFRMEAEESLEAANTHGGDR